MESGDHTEDDVEETSKPKKEKMTLRRHRKDSANASANETEDTTTEEKEKDESQKTIEKRARSRTEKGKDKDKEKDKDKAQTKDRGRHKERAERGEEGGERSSSKKRSKRGSKIKPRTRKWTLGEKDQPQLSPLSSPCPTRAHADVAEEKEKEKEIDPSITRTRTNTTLRRALSGMHRARIRDPALSNSSSAVLSPSSSSSTSSTTTKLPERPSSAIIMPSSRKEKIPEKQTLSEISPPPHRTTLPSQTSPLPLPSPLPPASSSSLPSPRSPLSSSSSTNKQATLKTTTTPTPSIPLFAVPTDMKDAERKPKRQKKIRRLLQKDDWRALSLYTKVRLQHKSFGLCLLNDDLFPPVNLPPLHYAIHCSAFRCLEFLMGHEAVDIEKRDAGGNTILHAACLKGNESILKLILAQESVLKKLPSGGTALFNAEEKEGNTCLHFFFQSFFRDECFLEHTSGKEKHSTNATSAFSSSKRGADGQRQFVASHSSSQFMMDLREERKRSIIKAGGSVDDAYFGYSPSPSSAPSSPAVTRHSSSPSSSSTSRDKESMLQLFANVYLSRNFLPQKYIFDILLLNGVDVNHQNNWGETPLHIAVKNTNPTVALITAEYLLKNAASPNLTTKIGESPLHVLLNTLAKVSPASSSPSSSSTEDAELALVDLMLFWGADVKLQNSRGQTARNLATELGQEKIAALLKSEEVLLKFLKEAKLEDSLSKFKRNHFSGDDISSLKEAEVVDSLGLSEEERLKVTTYLAERENRKRKDRERRSKRQDSSNRIKGSHHHHNDHANLPKGKSTTNLLSRLHQKGLSSSSSSVSSSSSSSSASSSSSPLLTSSERVKTRKSSSKRSSSRKMVGGGGGSSIVSSRDSESLTLRKERFKSSTPSSSPSVLKRVNSSEALSNRHAAKTKQKRAEDEEEIVTPRGGEEEDVEEVAPVMPPVSRRRGESFREKKPWEIQHSEVVMEGLLGEGGSGAVYKGKWRGIAVAIKKLKGQSLMWSERETFVKEIDMMSQLRHPNIVLFMGACLQPGSIFFLTEFADRGNLNDCIKKQNPPWNIRLRFMRDIARGMTYLHQNNPPILHRDLKGPNILINEDFKALVSDFGISAQVTSLEMQKQAETTFYGTMNWLSPDHQQTTKSDVYSFGLVMWENLTGEFPFVGYTPQQWLTSVHMKGERPPIPAGTDVEYVALMTQCWNASPGERPDFVEVLERLEAMYQKQATMS
ncbi:Pre-mRNA 3'-end-processing factor FIP1 [Balamuthia mandrillaris]